MRDKKQRRYVRRRLVGGNSTGKALLFDVRSLPVNGNTYLHKNGGGRILGAESGIGSDCYLDSQSALEGRSFVSCQSSITFSAVSNSSVSHSDITESVIVNSHIAGAIVTQAALENVIVRGTAERKAVVENVDLSGDVVVEGCRVRNVRLSGPHLLHTDWDRAPRVHLLEYGPVRIGLSECGREDQFHVACCCRNFAEWDTKEDLLRKIFVGKRNWPTELFNSIRSTFAQWR